MVPVYTRPWTVPRRWLQRTPSNACTTKRTGATPRIVTRLRRQKGLRALNSQMLCACWGLKGTGIRAARCAGEEVNSRYVLALNLKAARRGSGMLILFCVTGWTFIVTPPAQVIGQWTTFWFMMDSVLYNLSSAFTKLIILDILYTILDMEYQPHPSVGPLQQRRKARLHNRFYQKNMGTCGRKHAHGNRASLRMKSHSARCWLVPLAFLARMCARGMRQILRVVETLQ